MIRTTGPPSLLERICVWLRLWRPVMVVWYDWDAQEWRIEQP